MDNLTWRQNRFQIKFDECKISRILCWKEISLSITKASVLETNIYTASKAGFEFWLATLKLKFHIFSCVQTKFKQNDHIFISPSAHFVVLGTSYAFVVTAFWSVLGATRKVIYVRIQRNNFFIARRGAKSINEIELFMGRIIGGHLIALLAFPNLLPPLFRTCAERRPSVGLSIRLQKS